MTDLSLGQEREHFGHDRSVGQCLKGERRDELLSAFGHDHIHLSARLDQATRQIHGLVGCDSAGDAQNDFLILDRIVSHSAPSGTGTARTYPKNL